MPRQPADLLAAAGFSALRSERAWHRIPAGTTGRFQRPMVDGCRYVIMARFHLIAGHEHEGGSVDFSADDVSHALSLAYQLTAGHTFELWQEKRKICTIHSRAGLPAI